MAVRDFVEIMVTQGRHENDCIQTEKKKILNSTVNSELNYNSIRNGGVYTARALVYNICQLVYNIFIVSLALH